MKKVLLLVLIAVMIFAFSGCASEKSEVPVEEIPTDVVAVANGQEISLDDYTKNFKILEYTYTMTYGEAIWQEEYEGRPLKDVIVEELIDNLIQEKIIAQVVIDSGAVVTQEDIDSYYAEFQSSVESDEELAAFYLENGIDEAFIKQQIEMQLMVDEFYYLIEDEVKNDEAKLEDFYENFKLEVNASHILVTTQAVAEATLSRLETEDFATVAMEVSEDPGSKDSGGDLGYFARNVMVPEFEAAAFELGIGEMSGLIETDYGYHIIKVNDIHTLNGLIETGITEEEITMFKNYILSYLANSEFESRITELYDSADVQKYMENVQ